MLEDERKLRFGIWATTLSVLLQPCRTHGFMPWLEQLPTWSLVLSWLWPSRKTPWPIARARRSCSGRSCVAKCGACWQERKRTTRAKCKTTWCHPSGSMHSTGSRIKTDVPRKSDARSQSWTSAAQETCNCCRAQQNSQRGRCRCVSVWHTACREGTDALVPNLL